VALHLALRKLVDAKVIPALPLRDTVAAISCGIHQCVPVLDLEYVEDSEAEADANFVLTASGKIVEVQATAETAPFAEEEFSELLRLARKGVGELVRLQRAAVGLGGGLFGTGK
jgi:ribonuclease PH